MFKPGITVNPRNDRTDFQNGQNGPDRTERRVHRTGVGCRTVPCYFINNNVSSVTYSRVRSVAPTVWTRFVQVYQLWTIGGFTRIGCMTPIDVGGHSGMLRAVGTVAGRQLLMVYH